MTSEAHTYEEATKQGLQAVIVAESFQLKFRPISHEKAKCMFPIANIPNIHYVIEFLLNNKVTEIFIASCVHRNQIQAFVNSQGYKGVKIQLITLEDSSNFGDVLREINQLQTIKDDFILVRSDIITNADIQEALKEHFTTRKEDKERKLILTKLFIRIPFSNDIRSPQQEMALILDNGSKEILKYDSFETGYKNLKINEEYIALKQSNRKLEIRFDLIDTEISICSKDVLNHFTDNFDYISLNDDFINSLQASEIIDDRIMAYELDSSNYFGRIIDPRTYAAITQDILSRYVHPMVLDSKVLCPKNNYTFQSINKYIEKEVSLTLTTQVTNNCCIGKKCTIGLSTMIEKSTLGKNVTVGKNVIIKNSYIWDNVLIEDGVVIQDAIICDSVIIRKNAKIGPGSLISFNVVVKEGAELPKGSMASKFTFSSETLKFEEAKTASNEFFEVGVISYLPRECILKESEQIGAKNPYLNEEESDLEETDEDEKDDNAKEAFNLEVKQTIERCIKNKFPLSNALMEIKSLKMSENMTYSDCIEAIIPPIIEQSNSMVPPSEGVAKFVQGIQNTFNDWKQFIKDFCHEHEDQFTVIRSVEIYCAKIQRFNSAFHIIIQVLYTHKILKEETILKWEANAKDSLTKYGVEDQIQDEIFDFIDHKMREKFIKDMSKFVDWLRQQADESGESESDSGEEEEEGEDDDEDDDEESEDDK